MSVEPHQEAVDEGAAAQEQPAAPHQDSTEGQTRSGGPPTVEPVRPPETEPATRVDPTAGSTAEPDASVEVDAAVGSAEAASTTSVAVEPVQAVRLPPPPLPVPRSSRPRRFGALMLELLLIAVTMFAGWFVWSLRTWARGQTPAKSLLSMRCVRIETARVASWRTMALREFVGKGLLGVVTAGVAVIVSGVMIARSSRTGLWDRMAGTTVVDDPDGLTL